ncbi:Phosphonates import ATP-binding protein PhnC [Trichinella pseudospiralis]
MTVPGFREPFPNRTCCRRLPMVDRIGNQNPRGCSSDGLVPKICSRVHVSMRSVAQRLWSMEISICEPRLASDPWVIRELIEKTYADIAIYLQTTTTTT